LSKIKEKKLNSIKSEMEQIKKYIASSHTFDNSKHYDSNFSNNNLNDTITLTKVVKNENKITNNNDLDEIKKELIELKHAISDNNEILKEILLKTN
tara:strand:- start:433 stop:720 length:288 start_codon:yes stop_codon:yes gene_type:complete